MNPSAPRSARPSNSREGLNVSLLRAVPPEVLRVLEVGCGSGRLGAALKSQDARRVVLGVERDPQSAARAGEVLDTVFVADAEREDIPVEPGSLDALLYGDVLEHFADPLAVLLRHRLLLRPGGLMLCCVPNVQHHSVLIDLLQGDWQYRDAGLLDRDHQRFFTYSTALKLLLDAGFAPRIVDSIRGPMSDALMLALLPLLTHLRLHPERTRHYLESYQYILRGDLLPQALDDEDANQEPLTLAVCVSDEPTLQANLLASPCLARGSPHQVLLFRGCGSAAEGLNAALAVGRHRVVENDSDHCFGCSIGFPWSCNDFDSRKSLLVHALCEVVSRPPPTPSLPALDEIGEKPATRGTQRRLGKERFPPGGAVPRPPADRNSPVRNPPRSTNGKPKARPPFVLPGDCVQCIAHN